MSALLLDEPRSIFGSAELIDTAPRRFTSAAIGRVNLVIATVQLVNDEFLLVEDACRQYPLPGRDQIAFRDLHRQIEMLTAEAGICDILLRQMNANGPEQGSGDHFKMEALLQLIPGLVTRHISSQTVNTWRRKPHFPPPEPPACELRWEYTMQEHAVATACLAEMMTRGPLPWQPRSKNHG